MDRAEQYVTIPIATRGQIAIVERLERIEQLLERMLAVYGVMLVDEPDECQHPRMVDLSTPRHPHRICPDCRYEERPLRDEPVTRTEDLTHAETIV